MRFLQATVCGVVAIVLSIVGATSAWAAPATQATVATTAAETVTAEEKHAARAKVAEIIHGTETARWRQTTWERKGDEEDRTVGVTKWWGQNKQRLDIKEGRGRNAAVVLKGDRLWGFKRRLSFIKLEYHVREEKVLSIRGHDMRENGFMDEYTYMLEHWDRVTMTVLDEETLRLTFPFRDTHGFGIGEGYDNDTSDGRRDSKQVTIHVWADRSTLLPRRTSVVEDGETVEKYRYEQIERNVELDPEEFET